MASSSFYSGSSQDATNVNAVEDSKNAAALSEAAAAASATAAANSAASGASSASTATTKASESSASATASATSAAASQVSRLASEAAKVASETAKTAAETARDAAASSSTAATASQAAASSSETNSANSAAAALASKNAAATSATTAAAEAANSATSSAASEVSNVASGVAKVAAETAEANAETAQAASEAARDAAAVSQAAAATSETNAASSSATAATQAGVATTKAGEAATSATAAASSASSAQASKDAALAALDSFDDRYLGQKTTDPTVDNDGNALVAGALYFNTTDDAMKVYEGSVWVAAYASLSGAMLSVNNLSDVADAATSRTNLGLGTAATTASTDYATAAQGALADSATQPGDLATVATSGAYSDLSGTPTLGTAATAAATDFVAVTGDTMTGDLSFGDNDKAIFGNKPDLQIYHDGSNSYIDEVGAGVLKIRSNSNGVDFESTGGETLAQFVPNGAVTLYHNNASKLATTSSGVDVTGTLTSDGLTVDANASSLYSTDATLSNYATNNGVYLNGHATGWLGLRADGTGSTRIDQYGSSYGEPDTIKMFTGFSHRLRIQNNGDISFFEDTGTTPKFFWDASAESLGIGTSSPTTKLQSKGGSISTPTNNAGLIANASASFVVDHGNDYGLYTGYVASANDAIGIAATRTLGGTLPLSLQPFGGNVGIGTSSPATTSGTYKNLQVALGATVIGRTDDTPLYLSSNLAYNYDWKYIANTTATQVRLDTNIKFFTAPAGTAGNTATLSEAMRIDSSGNLLVGGTSAGGSSTFTAYADGQIHAYRGTATGRAATFTATTSEVGYFDRLSTDGDIVQFAKNGTTVGSIGTKSGNPYLANSTNGGIHLGNEYGRVLLEPCNEAGTPEDNLHYIGSSTNRWRDGYFSGTVNANHFNTTSDATLKTNVETLTGSLDAVKSLRGVSFDWIENGNSDVGVIAQEVEAVLPDVVSTNDQGIKSVKYGNMVALLIEAMKEQQAQIDELKAKLGE